MPFDWLMRAPLSVPLVRSLSYRVIRLRRAGALQHFVSCKLAQINGDWSSEKVYNQQTLTVNPWELLAYISHRATVEDLLDQFTVGMPSTDVYYEHLLSPGVHRQLCEFLGVDDQPLVPSATTRARQKPLHEAVTNFDEIVAFLRGTPYSSVLDLIPSDG
jgi:hypothetical protein